MLIYLYAYKAMMVNKGSHKFGWQMLGMERVGGTNVEERVMGLSITFNLGGSQ